MTEANLSADCPNCGAAAPDRFCPGCGQEQRQRLVSLRRMVTDFLDDQVSLNATLPRTLRVLFLRPGDLTREYVRGRVARYIRPFRLLLVSVVLLFLGVSLVGGARAATEWVLTAGNVPVAVPPEEIDDQGRPRWTNVQVGYELDALPRFLRPAAIRMEEQADRLNTIPPREALRMVLAASINAAARMVLLMVPVFALILKLLHLFRRRLVAEHFVFALHLHAAAFLAFLAAFLVAIATRHWLPLAIAGAYMAVYLPVALARAYAQPWWLALIKTLAIWMIYPAILGIGIAITVWIGIFVA